MSKTNTSKSSTLKYFKAAKNASNTIISLDEKKINAILKALAKATISESETLLKANKKDLARMPTDNPKYDRLKLTEQQIKDIANDIVNVSKLPFPIGKVLEERTMQNGLNIRKVSVSLGVIGIIYEARPNVTFDAFSLCLKSGNVCILKGGSDAQFSNEAIVALIRSVLNQHGLDENIITLLPHDRKATAELLEAIGYVDVIIPRGSQQLINFVRQNAQIPIIETGAGVVHVFIDESGDIEKGKNIIFNSKTRRVSVCNALDCLLINTKRLKDLPALIKPLAEKDVVIYADIDSYKILKNNYPVKLLQKAKQEHFGTEFLDYKMAIKTVKNSEEAINHIATFGSKHSESIVSENQKNINKFTKEVDAAVVYINTSTAFTDGAQFGLGAEIGISTQKLHARGPMALNEMTTYKWIVKGQGQVRK